MSKYYSVTFAKEHRPFWGIHTEAHQREVPEETRPNRTWASPSSRVFSPWFSLQPTPHLALGAPCFPFKTLAHICTKPLPMFSLAHLRQAGTFIKNWTQYWDRQKGNSYTKYKQYKNYHDSPGQLSDHDIPLSLRRPLYPAKKSVWPSPFTPTIAATPVLIPEQVPHYPLTQGSQPSTSSSS